MDVRLGKWYQHDESFFIPRGGASQRDVKFSLAYDPLQKNQRLHLAYYDAIIKGVLFSTPGHSTEREMKTQIS